MRLAIFLITLFLFVPFSANAGLVPCGSTSVCTLCDLIVGIKGIVDFGLGLLITVAFVAIVIAGVMYAISSGDEGMIKTAKSFITSALIGFTLVLGAWLIVNVAMWILSAKDDLGIGKKSWYEFECRK